MGSDASVTICADANGLAEGAAQLVVDAANEAAEARGRFMLCLAGGATPRATYERLARTPLSARMPWDRTWIFFGDERAVAPDDDESNYRMAQGVLRHSIVRFVVVRRHGAFVAEEDPRSIPRHARAERRTREPFIRRARRRAAGQTEHETPARLGRLVRGVDDELGRPLGEPVCIRADGYAGIRSHTLIIRSRRSGAVALAHRGSARGGPGRV